MDQPGSSHIEMDRPENNPALAGSMLTSHSWNSGIGIWNLVLGISSGHLGWRALRPTDQRSPASANRNLRFAGAKRVLRFPRESSSELGFLPGNAKPTPSGVGFCLMWSHLGSNQGPSDYESDALTD